MTASRAHSNCDILSIGSSTRLFDVIEILMGIDPAAMGRDVRLEGCMENLKGLKITWVEPLQWLHSHWNRKAHCSTRFFTPSLQRLEYSGCAPLVLRFGARSASLVELHVSHCHWSWLAVEKFSETLSQNRGLKTLTISNITTFNPEDGINSLGETPPNAASPINLPSLTYMRVAEMRLYGVNTLLALFEAENLEEWSLHNGLSLSRDRNFQEQRLSLLHSYPAVERIMFSFRLNHYHSYPEYGEVFHALDFVPNVQHVVVLSPSSDEFDTLLSILKDRKQEGPNALTVKSISSVTPQLAFQRVHSSPLKQVNIHWKDIGLAAIDGTQEGFQMYAQALKC